MGHLTRYEVTDPNILEVLHVMKDNHFDLFGPMTTYDRMYSGMSAPYIPATDRSMLFR